MRRESIGLCVAWLGSQRKNIGAINCDYGLDIIFINRVSSILRAFRLDGLGVALLRTLGFEDPVDRHHAAVKRGSIFSATEDKPA